MRSDTASRESDVNDKRSGTKEQQHALPSPVSVHREVGPTYRCCDEVVPMTLEAGPAFASARNVEAFGSFCWLDGHDRTTESSFNSLIRSFHPKLGMTFDGAITGTNSVV